MSTTLQLENFMKNDPYFLGVFSIDKLPIKLVPRPGKLIVNLDPSYLEGSHWIALFFPRNGPGIYFDSFANHPPERIETFLERNSPRGYLINTAKVQEYWSDNCGLFCIQFLRSCPKYMRFFNKFQHCRNNENRIANIDHF